MWAQNMGMIPMPQKTRARGRRYGSQTPSRSWSRRPSHKTESCPVCRFTFGGWVCWGSMSG
jgi:hypothetical protein